MGSLLRWFSLQVKNALSTAGKSMTSSERLSLEQLLKKEASPAALSGREFQKCSGGFKCLLFVFIIIKGLGDPSRTLEGNSRKSSERVSEVFPEFSGISSGKSQPYWGYGLSGSTPRATFELVFRLKFFRHQIARCSVAAILFLLPYTRLRDS